MRLPPLPFRKNFGALGNCGVLSSRMWYITARREQKTIRRQKGNLNQVGYSAIYQKIYRMEE